MQALGMAANRVAGSWLVFGELGLHRKQPGHAAGIAGLCSRRWLAGNVNRVLSVLGVEYKRFSVDTLLSLEVDNIHTRGDVSNLGIET